MSEQKKPSIEIEHFSFYYPEQAEKTLDDLTLTVERGEFLVLCGPSGCGKSTLLRQLKTVLAPHGRRMGHIRFEGRPLEELDQREQSARIGFVQQSPENQIVTDKVWHELAFGLESLGYDTPTIRRRVAEMASFFGIQTWFYKNVTELSGGQKQLLNLASIMAMQPSVLILDEPTSQLDPIAAADFLATLGKINRELGTTVVLTEHRLEDAFLLASRVAVMDRGRLLCTGSPAEVGAILRGAGHSMFLAMPTPMRIWASAPDAGGHCPVTVREGRDWLTKFADGHPLMELPSEPRRTYPNEPAITAEGLWFKYEKELPDVVKGLSLTVRRGEFLALLGGNGTGKTTILKIINGIVPADSGEIRLGSRVHIGYYDQEHHVLHNEKTLFQELSDTYPGMNNTQIRNVLAAFLFTGEDVFKLIGDLSGGEKGRVSLAKLMLSEANFLILDEPTNHLDITSKEILENALNHYTGTVLYVSHDRYFINRTATRILDLTHNTLVNYIGNYDYYLEKRDTMEQLLTGSAGNGAAKNAGSGTAGQKDAGSLPLQGSAKSTAAGSVSFTADGAVNAASLPWAGAAKAAPLPSSAGKTDWKQQKEEQARLRKRQNELKKTEDAIHELETRDAQIDALLCEEEIFSDVAKLMELNSEKQSISEKLEELYERWEELAED